MARSDGDSELWWQTLLRAAVELWTTHATMKVLNHAGDDGGLSFWAWVRRLASAVAYRFGRLAIYAERRYDQARA